MGRALHSAGDLFLAALGARDVSAHTTGLTSSVTAAPADASLAPGQFKLWLDATPGATKLMIKAKDSGGTVRTGSVNLS